MEKPRSARAPAAGDSGKRRQGRSVARPVLHAAAAALSASVLSATLVFASPEPAAAASPPRCNSALQVGSIRVPAHRATHTTVFCTMPVGHTGAGVKQLQTTLNICYGQNLKIDGIYGWKTSSAVAAAQRAERMDDVDGVYGPDTAMSIKHQHVYRPVASMCAYQ